ncbi:predicted protein [Naegleria gruberi]|uniref:Predicted protein n=1 Tax=Naegleria gruberi TaxID=5762 RepID=D2VC47_NAEGR|nr:uncharacterized protein NAEGRDRAFT_48345 [Naegleria gruberi]EFC45594.1 predicted protein [Naegleria gruberi]|eukprot:XP_002678338.1 predicted protein [Naegleria gruberi strain NEG-M]
MLANTPLNFLYNILETLRNECEADSDPLFKLDPNFQQLDTCIRNGDLSQIANLLSTTDSIKFIQPSREGLNEATPCVNYPLELAVKLGNIECIEFLLQNGAKQDSDTACWGLWNDCHHSRAFILACLLKNPTIVKTLMKFGINGGWNNQLHSRYYSYTYNHLLVSILNQDLEITRIILSHKPDLVNQSCCHLTTRTYPDEDVNPLAVACTVGNVNMVKMLVEDFSAKMNDGQVSRYYICPKPLVCAAKYGHLNVVRYLLRKGVITSDLEDGLEDGEEEKLINLQIVALVREQEGLLQRTAENFVGQLKKSQDHRSYCDIAIVSYSKLLH